MVASTDLLLLLMSEGEIRDWRVRVKMSSSERVGRCHMRSCVPVCVCVRQSCRETETHPSGEHGRVKELRRLSHQTSSCFRTNFSFL